MKNHAILSFLDILYFLDLIHVHIYGYVDNCVVIAQVKFIFSLFY